MPVTAPATIATTAAEAIAKRFVRRMVRGEEGPRGHYLSDINTTGRVWARRAAIFARPSRSSNSSLSRTLSPISSKILMAAWSRRHHFSRR